MQNPQNLTNRIARLTPAQQAVVEKLVQMLESAPSKATPTLDQAIDEFERKHPELLRLLAR